MKKSTEQLTLDFLTRRAQLRERAPAQGLAVENISEQEYRRVIQGSEPAITTWAFSPKAKAGGRCFVNVWIANPSAERIEGVNLSLFFGAMGSSGELSTALAARRQRWPYRSIRVELPQGQRAHRVRVDYQVPSGASVGCYYGNLVLWRGLEPWSRVSFWTEVG